ncbi:hypothetical protein BJ165DRAFT_1517972, partial [Panaeolus papilionaceus]
MPFLWMLLFSGPHLSAILVPPSHICPFFLSLQAPLRCATTLRWIFFCPPLNSPRTTPHVDLPVFVSSVSSIFLSARL